MSADTTFITSINARNVERNGQSYGLEQSPYIVLAVAGARVYHTKLNTKDSQWVYSRWKGTLSFGQDVAFNLNGAQTVSETERYWFRLADSETGRTVWMFKFPENFEYVVDRPFFHVFQGRTRTYGFLFNDDDEAFTFGTKVSERLSSGRASHSFSLHNLWANLFHKPTISINIEPPKKSRKLGAFRSKSLSSAISRALISQPAPHSFKHVAHVGVNREGVFEASKDLDDQFRTLLADLQGHDVREAAIVMRQSNFVDGFWQSVDAVRLVDDSEPDRFDGRDLHRRMATVAAF